MINYVILIPAYNAQNTLIELLEQITSLKPKPDRIIVVNDGSNDRTPELAGKYTDCVINLHHNRGKGFALRKGFADFLNETKSDYLLCMDADLQHPVSHIHNFIKAAQTNRAGFIIGKRSRTKGTMPLLRIISNFLSSKILSVITKQKIEDSQCGFRLIHRNALEKLTLYEDGFQLESEMIIQAAREKIKISFVDIPTIYNGHLSHINHLGDTMRFIKLILSEVVNRK
jgi:glycosyltransferase involved in cell wall biosynthesis